MILQRVEFKNMGIEYDWLCLVESNKIKIKLLNEKTIINKNSYFLFQYNNIILIV